jgi:hypothetical protein
MFYNPSSKTIMFEWYEIDDISMLHMKFKNTFIKYACCTCEWT